MSESDRQIIEQNRKEMQRLYDENKHLTDTVTIQKMADRLLESLQESGGHFCLHESDFGQIKESLKNIEKAQGKNTLEIKAVLKELIEAKNDHATRLTTLETQKATTIAIVVAVFSTIMSIATLAVSIWAIVASGRELKESKLNIHAQTQIQEIARRNADMEEVKNK